MNANTIATAATFAIVTASCPFLPVPTEPSALAAFLDNVAIHAEYLCDAATGDEHDPGQTDGLWRRDVGSPIRTA